MLGIYKPFILFFIKNEYNPLLEYAAELSWKCNDMILGFNGFNYHYCEKCHVISQSPQCRKRCAVHDALNCKKLNCNICYVNNFNNKVAIPYFESFKPVRKFKICITTVQIRTDLDSEDLIEILPDKTRNVKILLYLMFRNYHKAKCLIRNMGKFLKKYKDNIDIGYYYKKYN